MNDAEMIAMLRNRKGPGDLERADQLEYLGQAIDSVQQKRRGGKLNPKFFYPMTTSEIDNGK